MFEKLIQNTKPLKMMSLNYIGLFFAVSFLFFSGHSNSQIISSYENNPFNQSRFLNRSSPNSSVTLDFSISQGESWDLKDRPSNLITNCIDGTTITGFEFVNVSITTVGESLLSEAVLFFSDSSNSDESGIRLTIGSNQEVTGTQVFNSNGILDISDSGNNDVVSLLDGHFNLQLFEKIDDIENAIDARYTSGQLTIWGEDLNATNKCQFIAGSGNNTTDLSVSYTTDQSDANELGESITYTIEVDNNGDNIATNVTLENNLSDNIAFNNIECNDGTNSTITNDILLLEVNDIATNAQLTCELNVTIEDYGVISNSVTVNAENDSNSSNNSDSVITTGATRIIPTLDYFGLFLLLTSILIIARKKLIKFNI